MQYYYYYLIRCTSRIGTAYTMLSVIYQMVKAFSTGG